MRTVNIHEAKTHLSRLVERVLAGEEIVIARGGNPVAKLVPYALARHPRTPGSMKGRLLWMANDFDDLPEEVVRSFEEESPQ